MRTQYLACSGKFVLHLLEFHLTRLCGILGRKMDDEETGKMYELQSSMYRLASLPLSSKAEQSSLFLIFVGRVDSTSTDEKAKECGRNGQDPDSNSWQ